MTESSRTSPVVPAVLVLAALGQIVATLVLAFAPAERLQAAASTGAAILVVTAGGVLLGIAAAWWLRRRPLVAALVLLVLQAAVLWPAWRRYGGLGLAYWGESILHHFLTLLAATWIALLCSQSWRTGSLRRAFALLGCVGLVGVLAQHFTAALRTDLPPMVSGAAAVLLGLGCVGLTLASLRGGNLAGKLGLLLLAALLLLRALQWAPLALPLPDSQLVALVLLILGSLLLTRAARGELFSWSFALACALGMTFLLHSFWRDRFGQIEDELGPLLGSFAGGPLPFPGYSWRYGALAALAAAGAAALIVQLLHRRLDGVSAALKGIMVIGLAGLLWDRL